MNECSCGCGCGDGEYPDVYNESWPVARKTYCCCECQEDITAGNKYHKYRALWCGVWQTYYTCKTCFRIREDFCKDGWQFEQLRDSISECYGFDYLTLPDDDEE